MTTTGSEDTIPPAKAPVWFVDMSLMLLMCCSSLAPPALRIFLFLVVFVYPFTSSWSFHFFLSSSSSYSFSCFLCLFLLLYWKGPEGKQTRYLSGLAFMIASCTVICFHFHHVFELAAGCFHILFVHYMSFQLHWCVFTHFPCFPT